MLVMNREKVMKMHYKKHSAHILENEERLEKREWVVLSSHVFDDNVCSLYGHSGLWHSVF